MELLCSSFALEQISHSSHITRKKAYLLLSNLKQTTRNEVRLRLHFWIPKIVPTNFKTKVELPRWSTILPSYPRLTSAIFITKVFYTIAKASSIIFDLHLQIFAEAKIFELERLFFFFSITFYHMMNYFWVTK